MTDDTELDRLTSLLARTLADQGKLIEAGWTLLKMRVFPHASQAELEKLRSVFFAGAQHTFGSLVGMLEEDQEEPTALDLKRMENLHTELNEFLSDFTRRHPEARPQ